ncbi:ABC transporter permease [Undibacterium sp. Di26W]|uniref:ABC transporter permease n=1 Tax=Undibacterium sp. Di26W TaxID=3413035 RepID=UPI003BF1CE18
MNFQLQHGWALLRGWVVPLCVLSIAEMAMRQSGIQSDALAKPSDIIFALKSAWGERDFWNATAQTLGAALAGLALGGGIGLAIGCWFGLSPISSRLGALTVQLLMPIPSVALIPITMMIFGFGYRMEITVIAFTCCFPMLMLTKNAVAHVERQLLDVAKVLGLSIREQVKKIILPAALPRIFIAFRLSSGIALVVAVTVEIAANPYGLGYAMMSAQQNLRPELMLALLIWIGVIGWALNLVLIRLQAQFFRPFLIREGR